MKKNILTLIVYMVVNNAFAFESAEGLKLRELAEGGDAQAQFELAESYSLYGNSDGVKQAIKWYSKAGEQGNIDAQKKLADYYTSQVNTLESSENIEKKIYWYTKLAELGLVSWQYGLASFYENGIGDFHKSRNYVKAIEWYKKAAEQGNAESMYHLASMFDSGEGTEENPKEALNWYLQAYKQGYQKQFTADRISFIYQYELEDFKQAYHWKKEAYFSEDYDYRQTDCYGKLVLGELMKEEGLAILDDVEEDKRQEKAYEITASWYRDAAMLEKCTAGKAELALLYLEGKGVTQSYTEALKWFNLSTEQSLTQYHLGLMYEEGKGVERNLEEAKKWYELAVEQGVDEALKRLEDGGFRKNIKISAASTSKE